MEKLRIPDRQEMLKKIHYSFPYILMLCCAKLLQSCLTLGDPMDCSPAGSSVYGILQTRILK